LRACKVPARAALPLTSKRSNTEVLAISICSVPLLVWVKLPLTVRVPGLLTGDRRAKCGFFRVRIKKRMLSGIILDGSFSH
jgi:hypothetical protein